MKLSCSVVTDLLPLYHDGVCSEESRCLVEEHLNECEGCKSLLSKINGDLSVPQDAIDEVKPLKSIRAAWNKGKRKALLKGAVIAIIACVVLLFGYLGLTRWKVIPVSADVLEVSGVYQLSDGRIIYFLHPTDNKNLQISSKDGINPGSFTLNADGSFYVTPRRSVFEDEWTETLFNEYRLIDISENNAWQQIHGDGVVITSYYIGTEDNAILLWEEGMELPPASEEMERLLVGSSDTAG